MHILTCSVVLCSHVSSYFLPQLMCTFELLASVSASCRCGRSECSRANAVLRVAGCGLQVVGCRVVVCRDAAAGTCRRAACRYYHIPVQLPPALRPP